jgi:hypothetical protein
MESVSIQAEKFKMNKDQDHSSIGLDIVGGSCV